MSLPDLDAEPGLRERKRLATKRAIEAAVLRLTAENGFDQVTVDEIASAAGVSPRTFFNYFPSKEAAIVGDVPALPNGSQIEAFVGAGPNETILDGIRDLLIDAVDDGQESEDRELHRLRRSLLRKSPQLFGMRMAGMKQLEADLTDVVRRRLERDDPGADDQDALESRARLITLVAFAGIRHAWWSWADRGGKEVLSMRVRESFEQLQALATRELR